MGIKGKNDNMVVLACEECKERNYTTTKNKKTNKDRMEMKKHCPRCNKHTVHKETKQRRASLCQRAFYEKDHKALRRANAWQKRISVH